ncbi:MAG: right-handed parallel beta-helix repeat-containing protein, partial [Saprospiraceae bacterium]|nr:right-handed parallel beta-helix repeat-containing protein [Saprospiraceae bacterium]
MKDSVKLIIPPCGALVLADGQQTDATGAVDIIIMNDPEAIEISGGGRVSGNTGGQTGWSGGYSQITNGIIIGVYGSSNRGIMIDNINLTDHWSNPVVLNNADNAVLKNISCSDVGEGLLIQESDRTILSGYTHADSSGTSVGDGFEWSSCTNALIEQFDISGGGSGAGIDVFGCVDCVVRDGRITKWNAGIAVQTNWTGDGLKSDNVLISNVRIDSCTGDGVQVSQDTVNVLLEHVDVFGSGRGFQINADGDTL